LKNGDKELPDWRVCRETTSHRFIHVAPFVFMYVYTVRMKIEIRKKVSKIRKRLGFVTIEDGVGDDYEGDGGEYGCVDDQGCDDVNEQERWF